jgi:Cu/Ag efflux pump CusA
MMYWIVNWSVKFRRIVIAVAAGLLLFGATQLDGVKQDSLPEFSPPTVEVQTEALGLSAAGVEQLITVPLEQDLLNGVAFLDTIESASLPGLSSVVMTFEPGTELLDARQVVAERLTQAAALPQVSAPPQMIQPLSSTSRVGMVSLTSAELSPIEMSVLARWVMVPRLLGVEGVANVAIWGFRDQQLQVLVDPFELARQSVTLGQVISTAGNALEVSPLSFLEASSPGTGGFIDTVNQRLHVFHEQAISTPEELAQVPLENSDGGAVFVAGNAVTLGDVAEIVTDHQPLIGDARCAGGPCILLVIEKFPDANTPEVASRVDDALDALSLGLPGMEIDTSVYRPAAFIDESTTNLRGALLTGGILLLLVLAALLFSWRVVLIAAVSIALSLAIAGLVLLTFDVTVNAMILAGLVMALVIIVDDAIVGSWAVVESAAAADQQPARVLPAVIDSILRFRSIAMYGAMIVVAAIVPVVAMEGEAGAFLEPIALAFLLAAGAAVLVSLTVAPALSVFLAPPPGSLREAPLGRRLREWYGRTAPRMMARPDLSLAIFIGFVAAGLIAIAFVTPSLRPALKERDILIELEAAAGTSLPRMDQITAEIVDDLGSQPGIANIGAHVGRAIASDQVVNVNSAEIWLNIDGSADYGAALAGIESAVKRRIDVNSHVTTYSDQRVTEILDRADNELVVRVYGESQLLRESIAEQVRGVMNSVAGVENARIESAIKQPTIEIEVDVEAAQVFGVKPGEVRRQATTLVSGLVVGNLFEDQKVFDVVVWGAAGIRDTVADIQTLPIATPSGDHVPLGDLADVAVVPNEAIIRHESVATYVDVSGRLDGRSPAAAAADIDERLAELAFPLEHHAEVLGGLADDRAARTRVIAASVAAAVLIYLLLQSAFTSWRLATLAFLLLPMGVSGSLMAVAVTGSEASLGSVAGIVAVFGLATRSVVMLIRSYQRRERHGDAFGEDLVLSETTHLIVPTMVSVIAIAVTFLPLAIFGSRAGLELVGPMAVAVLGGLVTTLLLVTFVVPAVYVQWGRVAEPDRSADDLFAAEVPVTTEVGA